MTDNEEIASVERIEAVRRVLRRAAEKCSEKGATIEEAAIGAAYAAFDLAERHVSPGQGAIEWLRTSCDVLEKGLLNGEARRPARRPS